MFVIEKLKEEQYEELENWCCGMRPYDLASLFHNLPERHRAGLLHHLSVPTLASMIQKLKRIHQLEVLSKIGPEKANKVLALLSPDILTSLLKTFPEVKLNKFLEEMEEEQAIFLRKVMSYPPHTAGSLMSNRYVAVRSFQTAGEAIDTIKMFAAYSESTNTVYVIDEVGKLCGSLSFRDLIVADPDEPVKNLMFERVLSVDVHTNRNEIATLLQRYDFLAIPVVNEEGILLGIITFDDMIDIIIAEANEDIGKMSAAGTEIDFDTKPFTAAIRRLPWLVILLFIGLFSGSIISRFEDTLNQVVALAFFMPLIAGMTGNTGTQSLAVVVRGLAENDINLKTVLNLIFREFRVGLMIGMTCGILISIIAFIWQGNMYLGFVVGGSLLMTLILGTLAGTVIPLILYKCKLDPAVASGPLITTVNDIFSLITYFSIATAFLSKLTS